MNSRLVCVLCGAPAKEAEDGKYRHAGEPWEDSSGFCEKYGYPIPVKYAEGVPWAKLWLDVHVGPHDPKAEEALELLISNAESELSKGVLKLRPRPQTVRRDQYVDIRCPDCGVMMTDHVITTRHAAGTSGGCNESFTGPSLLPPSDSQKDYDRLIECLKLLIECGRRVILSAEDVSAVANTDLLDVLVLARALDRAEKVLVGEPLIP